MTTAKLIETVLAASPETHDAILKAATGTIARNKTGTIRDAAKILGVCNRSVVRYAQQGLLRQIKITPRKIRYDLTEVERLATQGAESAGMR